MPISTKQKSLVVVPFFDLTMGGGGGGDGAFTAWRGGVGAFSGGGVGTVSSGVGGAGTGATRGGATDDTKDLA